MNLRLLRSFSIFFLLLNLLSFVSEFCQESLEEEAEFFFPEATIESASKYAQSIKEVPATVTIITSDTIEKMGFKTIADVLNFCSISMATYYDRRYEFGITRGFYNFEDYNTRLLVLVDGVIVNEPSNNFAGLDRSLPIPIELISKIEITYGPFGVLYGVSNLGGIINIITKDPSSIPKFFSKFSLGSFKTRELQLGYKFSTSLRNLPFEGYFEASSYDSDGIQSGTERVKLSPSDNWYGPLNWNYSPIYGGRWEERADFERSPSLFGKLRFGDFTLTTYWGYRKKGEPYAPWGDVYSDNNNWIKDEFAQYSASFVHPFSKIFSISAKAVYDDYSYSEKDTYADTTIFPQSTGYFWNDSMKTRRNSIETSALFNLTKSKYIFGVYFKREKLFETVWDESILEGRTSLEKESSLSQRARAFYALGEWKISDFLFSLASNYVKYNFTKGEMLYRGSLIYQFSDKATIKFCAGKGFRVPSYYEYAYSDSVSSLNNPTLKSEKSPSLEISLTFNPQLTQSYIISAFKQKISDSITLVTIESPSQIQGNVIPPNEDPNNYIGFSQYQNRGEVFIDGISFSGKWFFKEGLSFYSNISYQNVRNKVKMKSDFRSFGSPRWTGNCGIIYETEKIFTSFALSYIGNFLTSEGHIEPPYKISDSLSGRLHLGIKNFITPKMTLTLTIINPFNFEGKVPLASSFIPSTGKRYDRSAIISLGYSFNFCGIKI